MTWNSPLKGYENAEPLPTTINPDGKSLYNPPGPLSAAYEKFPEPIDMSNNAFDFHGQYLPLWRVFRVLVLITVYVRSVLYAIRS